MRMKVLHIHKGFRYGWREVTGRHFEDYEVRDFDEYGNTVGTAIVTGAEIKNGVHEETGEAYDLVVYDD